MRAEAHGQEITLWWSIKAGPRLKWKPASDTSSCQGYFEAGVLNRTFSPLNKIPSSQPSRPEFGQHLKGQAGSFVYLTSTCNTKD